MCTPAPLPTPPKLVPPPPSPEDEHINVLQYYSQESQEFLVREGFEEANPGDNDPLMAKKSPKPKSKKKKKSKHRKKSDDEDNDEGSEADNNQSGSKDASKAATSEGEGDSTQTGDNEPSTPPAPLSRGPLPPRPPYFHSGWPVAEVTLASFACLGGGEPCCC